MASKPMSRTELEQLGFSDEALEATFAAIPIAAVLGVAGEPLHSYLPDGEAFMVRRRAIFDAMLRASYAPTS